MKKAFKVVLGKLPIFIFCVVFISTHNFLFGAENSIIGVIVLTGLLMLMRGEFGYKAEQAAGSIIFVFALMCVAPGLSLIHPVLGIAVNFFSIMLMMILSCHDLSQGNHIPFLMGYIFCQGYPIAGHAMMMRTMSLLIGGVVIAGIYYLANRKKTYKRTITDLFKAIDIHSVRTQWYIRMSVTLTASMFVCQLIAYPRTMWVALAVLSLTTPFGDEHAVRGKARIPAAIIGTAVFYIFFVILIPQTFQPAIVLLAGLIAMSVNDYFIKSIYNSFSALGTAVLLLPTKEALILRVASNVIGTVVAIVSYYLFTLLFRRISCTESTESEA